MLDGRNHDSLVIDNKRGLDFSKLSPYPGGPDVSYGLALVIYTANLYEYNKIDRVGFNVQSVVILTDM